MFIPAKTLDDLLKKIYPKLLNVKGFIKPTRGPIKEIFGALLELQNPQCRLSFSEQRGRFISCLGEFLWYLSKANDLKFISYYLPKYINESDDGRVIFGGYGQRLFNKRGTNQVTNIVKLLRRNPGSRRAVIQLFDEKDIAKHHKDIPCTCTLQFTIRDKQLHMLTNMRSNDAVKGLTHDIFAFTMLQEVIARTLNVKLGTYKHAVGSLHIYKKDIPQAKRYLGEGWQPTKVMPRMPSGNPWPSIRILLTAEKNIRLGKKVIINSLNVSNYWKDFVRILQAFYCYKNRDSKWIQKITDLKESMSTHFYDIFFERLLN